MTLEMYSLIRESYRKMRLASERRKRTQYLLDQITDDSVGEPEKEITGDELTQEFSESLEKIAEFACAPDDISDETEKMNEEEGECGPVIRSLSPESVPSKSPVINHRPPSSSSSSSSRSPSSSTNPSPTPSDSSPTPTSVLSSPSGSSTSPNSTTSPRSTSPRSADELTKSVSPTSLHINNQGDIKERLEKQRKQTQAMKEMLKRYKDGKKAAEENIAKSRAFLNENRLVGPKKVIPTPTKPTTPKPVKNIPPAVVVPPSTEKNYLVAKPKKTKAPPTTTTFIHMNDPDAGAMFSMGPYKNEPYFPKYMDMPKVGGGSRRGSNSSGMSDDGLLDEGIC